MSLKVKVLFCYILCNLTFRVVIHDKIGHCTAGLVACQVLGVNWGVAQV